MPLIFYPHIEDTQKGSLLERMDVLMEAAERYKAVVLDTANKGEGADKKVDDKKRLTPRDQVAAYNWEEVARVLRSIREMPEGAKIDKIKKADMFTKLAEVYEVLRGAKMSKLEAVRLALISEAEHLRGSAAQVA